MLAASSGPDLQQIIFVVVFIVIGLVQWLYKLWQEKSAHAERERQPPPSAEEQEARRRAWEEQNREVDTPVPSRPQPSRPVAPPPVPASPAPGGLGDLIDTFRKAMEEAQAPKPAAPPPPLPAPAPRSVSAPSLPSQQPAPPYVSPHPVAATSVAYSQPQRATSASSSVHAPTMVAKSAVTGLSFDQRAPTSQRRTHSLTAYLRSTGGYRKAFILKEVLDAPKALQKSPWPMD